MKRLIKAGLMVLMGTVIWINGGMVEKAKAQECAPGGNVLHFEGYSVCNYIGGNCVQHQPGQIPPSCLPQPEQPANPKPIIQKPSSYGAVAWGSWSYGSSTNQTNKQNAINAALQSCSNGGDSCKIQVIYSNQCVAQTYGIQKNGAYWWRISYGSTQKQATQAALKDCGKIAKNCQVSFSECSLP
jgi:hypothetical protein